MFDNIKKYFHAFLVKRKRIYRFTKLKKIQSGDESKTSTAKGEIVIVYSDLGSPKWLRFYCPCGCGKEIVLTLSKSNYHGWSVFEKNNLVTVEPSVIVEECGSHFWIRKSNIEWV